MSKVQELRVYISRDEKKGKLVKNRVEKVRKCWGKIYDESVTMSDVMLQLLEDEYLRLKRSGAIK